MWLYFLFILMIFDKMALAQKGILLSGGFAANTSVEVFNPNTNKSCLLPSLPEQRLCHTMDYLTICGGMYTFTSCITFSSGEWVTSHSLPEERWYHNSWVMEADSILLLGGLESPDTTDVVSEGVYEGGQGFRMDSSTMFSCSIHDETTNTLVITGGYYTLHNVSRYDTLGYLEELPSLINARWNHACGAYLREDGTQILLVTGGDMFDIRPTKILPSDSPGWLLASPLPRKMYLMKGVTVSGVLYMTGGEDGDHTNRDEILAWSGEDWVEVGKMRMARRAHGISTIRMDDEAMDHCV